MNKLTIMLFCLCIITVSIFAGCEKKETSYQALPDAEHLEVDWTRNYDGGETGDGLSNVINMGYTAVITGYVSTGKYYPPSTPHIVKIDSFGNITRDYEISRTDDSISCIKKDKNGDFIAVGREILSEDYDITNSNDIKQAIILKIKSDGTVLWRKEFDRYCSFNFVELTKDNNITVLKIKSKKYNDTYLYNYSLVKFDSDGTFLSEKYLSGLGMSYIMDIVSSGDDGFIISGVFSDKFDDYGVDDNSLYNIILAKIDSEGELIWEKEYGGSQMDELSHIARMSDGCYIGCGRSESTDGDMKGFDENGSVVFMKFDDNGNKEWIQGFSDTKVRGFSSIIETKNGNALIVGSIKFEKSDPPDALIIYFDVNDKTPYTYWLGGNRWASFSDVTQLDDGSFIAVGESSATSGDFKAEVSSNRELNYDGIIAKFTLANEGGGEMVDDERHRKFTAYVNDKKASGN